MSVKKYHVNLKEEERSKLLEMIRKGKLSARNEKAQAHLVAIACSDAPGGREHWSLRLLADQLVELGYVESISHETMRQQLKKTV